LYGMIGWIDGKISVLVIRVAAELVLLLTVLNSVRDVVRVELTVMVLPGETAVTAETWIEGAAPVLPPESRLPELTP
jgi:hypothetical protein